MVSSSQLLLATSIAAQGVFAQPPPYDKCKIVFGVSVWTRDTESIRIVGNIPEFGNWSPENAFKLNPSQWTSGYPGWDRTVELAPGSSFEWKLLWIKEDGSWIWEQDQIRVGGQGMNRYYSIPFDCNHGMGPELYLDAKFNNEWSRPEGLPQ